MYFCISFESTMNAAGDNKSGGVFRNGQDSERK